MADPLAKDYYKRLGVSKKCDDKDLKKAYRKLALQFHPDKNPDNAEAEEKFKAINEAYDTLSNKDKRATYDMVGPDGMNQVPNGGEGFANGGGMPPGFGGGFSGMRSGGGMSSEEAQRIFSMFFADEGGMGGMGGMGGSPFMEMGGGGMGGSPFTEMGGGGMRMVSMGGGSPFVSFGMGGMPGGMGGMGGMPQQSQKRARPERYDVMGRGAYVMIKGLSGAAERNGTQGRIESYDDARGRYMVRVEGEETTLALRPSNLEQLVTGAKVTGVTSDTSLNGKTGTVVGWDEEKERYSVRLSSQTRALSLRPECVVLPAGTCVTVRDVQAKPQLNGKRGKVQSYDYGAGRFVVQLSASEQLKLRPANLTTAMS